MIGKGKRNLLVLSVQEEERVRENREYLQALLKLIKAWPTPRHVTTCQSGADDLVWASELVSSVAFDGEHWYSSLWEKIMQHQLTNTNSSCLLRNLCLMDDIIWLLSEEIRYQDAYNGYREVYATNKSTGGTKAMVQMEIARAAANSVCGLKNTFIQRLYNDRPYPEAERMFRYEAATYADTRANQAINLRAYSQVNCPRRDTIDVLNIRTQLRLIADEYDKAISATVQ